MIGRGENNNQRIDGELTKVCVHNNQHVWHDELMDTGTRNNSPPSD